VNTGHIRRVILRDGPVLLMGATGYAAYLQHPHNWLLILLLVAVGIYGFIVLTASDDELDNS
jgi:hypothetical protein